MCAETDIASGRNCDRSQQLIPAVNKWSEEEGFGAGNEVRTRDLNLGKVALYQLSYSRDTPERPRILRNEQCLSTL